jgi:two-component system chemotaxis response regulator CheY
MQKTALVVDDVAFARRIIKEILIAAKYTIIGEAANGVEAVNMYNQLKPDFVTMDLVMPLRGGIEATRKILEDDKNARVIILSAMTHEQILMEAINAGARDFIVKPFEPKDLLLAVEKVLQGAVDAPLNKGAAHGSY